MSTAKTYNFEKAYLELIEHAKLKGKDLVVATRVEGLGGVSVLLGRDERQREVLAYKDSMEEALTVALERIKAPATVKPMGKR